MLESLSTSARSQRGYLPLHDAEESAEQPEKPAIGGIMHSHRTWQPALTFWMLLTAALGLLNVYQFQQSRSFRGVDDPSFSQGFGTDFEDTRRVLAVEQRNFTGWISYSAERDDVYRVVDHSEPQYFGEPSHEIDAAWDDLLYGQYVAMTNEEAARYPGIVTSAKTGKYHMQPDVYHSLHCLNAIRMELFPEYYKQHPRPDADVPVPPSWPQVHRDHCLDQIRQSLQCNADLSPAPFFTWEGLHLSIAEGRTHTCRKWSRIQDWVLERDRVSASVGGD